MTSTDFTSAAKPATRIVTTKSFGANRHTDQPASALYAGAVKAPNAWQTTGIADNSEHYQYGAPVRSLVDIAADPFRWALATWPRKLGFCIVALTGLVVLF